MKRQLTHCLCFVVLLTLAPVVKASPRGGSNYGIEYLAGESNKDNWSGGIYLHGRERLVKIGGTPAILDESRAMVQVGYQIYRWITVYGLAGASDSDLKPGVTKADSYQSAFGLGIEADIFSHEIQDPLLMEDKIRVNGSLSYQRTSVESFRSDLTLDELMGSLTISLVNDVAGNKIYHPESIAFYFGPIYNSILGNDIDDSPDQKWGFTGGLEVFHTERVSYFGQIESFEKSGYTAGLNVRF
ncbi:MAG: hypothetical protein O3A51_03595 [Verrucomicrobia bacterium]|nr:hypothetical protein [Verrucomicrobiota bacterium]